MVIIRHRPAGFENLQFARCGVRADKANIIALKSAVTTCPACLEIQAADRAAAQARLAEMLAGPRKGPLRIKPERPVEKMRFWSPAARRNPVRG